MISLKNIEKEFRQHIFDISVIKNSINDSKNLLSDALSDAESEIVDLNHILEYCSLSAAEMGKIAARLKKLFKVRREIKETYSFSEMISSKLLISDDLTEDFENRKTKRENNYQEESRQSFNRIFLKESE